MREKYNNIQTEEFFEDIDKLAKGEHIDYVIGFVEFLGCKIDLSQKPLIPRSETEYWVEKAIEDMKSRKQKNIRVLDVFSGSGCIGVALQKHVPSAVVTFAEVEKKLCEQIRINGGRKVIQSDIFSNIKDTYDYILANPPYVPEGAEVQQSVLKNEPLDAVFAGKDGLDYIRRFLQEAKNHLKEHGVIYMEFDPAQKQEIVQIVKDENYKSCEFFRDQYGKWRYIVAKV